MYVKSGLGKVSELLFKFALCTKFDKRWSKVFKNLCSHYQVKTNPCYTEESAYSTSKGTNLVFFPQWWDLMQCPTSITRWCFNPYIFVLHPSSLLVKNIYIKGLLLRMFTMDCINCLCWEIKSRSEIQTHFLLEKSGFLQIFLSFDIPYMFTVHHDQLE